MNTSAALYLLDTGLAESILAATLMMTAAGVATAFLLSRLSVQSWRLQSFLIAAVLLQGIMLIRTPVHLGWIKAKPTSRLPSTALKFTPPVDAMEISVTADSVGLDDPILAEQSVGVWDSAAVVLIADMTWQTLFGSVWLIGVIVLVCLSVYGYVRMVRLSRRLNPAADAWQRQWQNLSKHRGKRCRMLVSESVGPMMLRRPADYAFIVPETYWNDLSEHQRQAVMLHELAHLERHDVWRQLLARLVATIHWFNPISWWAMQRYEQAAELACDSRVTEEGEHLSAGFAAALVQLVQWHEQSGTEIAAHRGFGLQAMAAPPLTSRVSRLLKPNSSGDSIMKRVILALFALAIVGISFVQIRLTAADEDAESAAQRELAVLPEELSDRLTEIVQQLDRDDETTSRLASLADSASGRLAIGAYLNALRNRELESARADAVPRFLARYFTKTDDGKYQTRSDQQAAYLRWEQKSGRLQTAFEQTGVAMADIAARLDDSNNAGALMKRLLSDPQAPAALLLFEMQGGGDVITQYISKALGNFLVDRGDGAFQILESKRRNAEEQIGKLESASKIHKKLARELPLFADELDASDEQHQKFIRYLKNPVMPAVVAVVLTKEHRGNPAMAVEELFTNLEKASIDTANGLKITEAEVWQKLEEIYGYVDRAGGILPKIQERLAEVAETLSQDDLLAARLAKQMSEPPIAVMLAAELPYADADPGQMLRGQLSEVLNESDDGKLSIRKEKQEDISNKMQELLRVCRAIRRHIRTVDDVLSMIDDQQLVARLGDSGRYLLLSELRRSSESIRPDPIELMRKDLLATNEENKLRVREDRREIIRQMLEQAEKVRDQAANDDF